MDRRALALWAFGLTLAGAILLAFSGVDLLLRASDIRAADKLLPGQPFEGLGDRLVVRAVVGLAAGVALALVAVRMRSDAARAPAWAIAAIVLALVGLYAATWGPLLALAGGIVAIVAQRTAQRA